MFTHIPYFQQQSKEDLARVNAVVHAQVKSDVALIEEIGKYIVNAGGKRLRPLSVILAGKCIAPDSDELYRQASMIEFVHTSTLLHDDVVDESGMRRGRETANKIFGNAAAVLVGDFLYTRSFQLMVASGSLKIMQVMADATNIIASGEVMQLLNIANTDLTEEDYIQVIYRKTAKLFESAMQVGAIVAQANDIQENALKSCGKNMGIAFQIIDDLLDYTGDVSQTGKNVGDDLAEGKVTLPLIYLMRQKNDTATIIKEALTHARRDEFETVHNIIVASDALDYCHTIAKEYANQAIQDLAVLPQNTYTDTLAQMITASLNRLS